MVFRLHILLSEWMDGHSDANAAFAEEIETEFADFACFLFQVGVAATDCKQNSEWDSQL